MSLLRFTCSCNLGDRWHSRPFPWRVCEHNNRVCGIPGRDDTGKGRQSAQEVERRHPENVRHAAGFRGPGVGPHGRLYSSAAQQARRDALLHADAAGVQKASNSPSGFLMTLRGHRAGLCLYSRNKLHISFRLDVPYTQRAGQVSLNTPN